MGAVGDFIGDAVGGVTGFIGDAFDTVVGPVADFAVQVIEPIRPLIGPGLAIATGNPAFLAASFLPGPGRQDIPIGRGYQIPAGIPARYELEEGYASFEEGEFFSFSPYDLPEVPMNGFDFGDDFDLSDLTGLAGTIGGFFDSGNGVIPVAQVPATIPRGRPNIAIMASLVGKGVFNAFGKITQFGRVIFSYLRRFGPAGLFAAGFTAAEIANLLLLQTKAKRRRMNVLNPKALRRSTRRLIGFERRAARVSQALAGVCQTRGRVRARRCVKCRRSPCIC